MGMTGALNSALSGLRVTQSQMEVVSNNISNADTVGYSRRRVEVVQTVAGTRTTGAQAVSVNRQLDALLQRQLRTETSGAAYTNTRAQYAQQLDRMFGTPGAAGSLDGSVNQFTSALQTLGTNPADFTARAQVISNAGQLASTLNNLSQDIQRLRQDAEARIADGVARVNDALTRIANIEDQIGSNGQVFAQSAALLDERDKAILELSALVDVRVTEQGNGRINIMTTGGLQLYGGTPSRLSFDERGAIGPNDLFTDDPLTRGVGTIRMGGVDVIAGKLFRSGEIAANIDMRDKVLVEAQAQVDDLAAALASSLADRNPTTAYTNGVNAGFDVALPDVLAPGTLAMKAGNTLNIEVMTPAGPRRIQVIATDGAAPNPIPKELGEAGATLVRFDRSGGFAGLQAAVAGALGGGFTVSLQPGNVLRVVDAGGGNAVTNARASFSTSGVDGLTGEGSELRLFVDSNTGLASYTGSLDGLNPQRRGFAGRITLNAELVKDNSKLVVSSATTQQGDPARPRLLLDRLINTSRGFSGDSGIGGTSGLQTTIASFARRVVEDQGAKTTAALNTDEGQKVVLRAVEGKFSESSGVTIDQEMSDLVQIQNAYAANARVVAAVKELFDTLLRIGV